jgi:protein CWC15
VGQTSVDEIKKRDLRAELLAAEQEARNKKRKAEGLPPLEDSPVNASLPLDEEASKRRKLLQEAIELDKDDDDEEDGDEGKEESEKDDDR